MYHLLLNNAMYMCCMFLMIGSINLMVFVNQIHCALCDAATEFLCVIYVNFKLQHFTQAVTGREVWRKIRKALALEWTKLPYNSHHLLPASYHTNLGLIPGESIQDLWCTKCPGTDSSTVVRFPHQYHSTTTYLHLRTITTRNTTGQTLETFWKKNNALSGVWKQRTEKYSDSPPQTSKVTAKLEVQVVQPAHVPGPLRLTFCVLHVNITWHGIVSSYSKKSLDCS